MNASSFGGLWICPSPTFPPHDDFILIDEERRRIIAFVVATDDTKRAPMRNWYQPVSATSISVRLRPTDPWRVHEFQQEGDRLSWTYGGGVHVWQRIPWEQRPDWFDARLATAHAKMDATDECA